MRISHIVSSIDISQGGPSKSVSDLGLKLADKEIDIDLISISSLNPYLDDNCKLINLFLLKRLNKKSIFKVCASSNSDILHGHGIWQMPVHYMTNVSRKLGVPYIITPRGMLEPWALNSGKWKKRLALWLYQYKDLANAACIHATAQMEVASIRNLGLKNPIALIPNGINVSEYPLKDKNHNSSKRKILFLSRIHPKKGIELLIEAWEKLENKFKEDWLIEIAGNGDEDYIASLQETIDSKSLNGEIKITGSQFGDAKLECYHSADLFVLPTYSENFGIVVAEALACGVPVITTKGAPWGELNTQNAGWWIDIGVAPLIKAMEQAMSITDLERMAMGKNGRKLVVNNYSIASVANKMIRLYDWVLNKGEKPEFVYLD